MQDRPLRRRALLAGVATASALGFFEQARARTYPGGSMPPWLPFAADPPNAPQAASPVGWVFFTPEEGAAVEALVDRLIPPDPETPGGKDCGCAVFIDRQLAGDFGQARGLYMRPPFQAGTPQQGLQSPTTPAALYRQSLAALDRHCRTGFAGKGFVHLTAGQQDEILHALEKNALPLDGASGRPFFELLVQNAHEGFFADPVYGGNRDMAAWRMIGFPGARYDYRDWVLRHNERYPLPPVGLAGRPDWRRSP